MMKSLSFWLVNPVLKSADITTAVEQIKTIGEDWKSHQKMVVA
jgi:hypothetical protein